MDGQARGVFVGHDPRARKDAQKTDAQQTNKNLLLSREALVDSVPQLEILADDVKCKHGSTTGQLDPAALFYLRSRGIGEDAARSLLIYAFASDVVRAHQGRGAARGPRRATCASGCPARPTSRRRWFEHRRPSAPRGVAARPARRGARVRADFPILAPASSTASPLVYLDNAASSPEAAGGDRRRARGLRGATTPTSTAACTQLSMQSTDAYEAARGQGPALPQRRVDARRSIFTRGTTEAINLVAPSYGRRARRARATRC